MAPQMIRPPTLTAATVNAVRDAILQGDLKPGQPLREGELADSLSVARSTMREALRDLQEEGLVEVIPHRGVFVVQLSSRMVEELYTLRALLEPYAVRIAMEKGRYTPQDFSEMEALVRQMGKFARAGKHAEATKTDMEFHYQMCQPCDNLLVLRTLQNHASLVTMCIRHIGISDLAAAPGVQVHQGLLDAIRAGDPEHAAAVVRTHLVETGEQYTARMLAIEGQTSRAL